MEGANAQLMSDFQMRRVPCSQYRLYCRSCHRSRPPHLMGESAWASASSSSFGEGSSQTQDACNGGGAGSETVTMGVCIGAARQQPGSPTGQAIGMLQDLSSSF